MVNSWYPVYLYRAIRETNDLPFPFLIPRIFLSRDSKFIDFYFTYRRRIWNCDGVGEIRNERKVKSWKNLMSRNRTSRNFLFLKSNTFVTPDITSWNSINHFPTIEPTSLSTLPRYITYNKPIRNSSTKKRHTFHRWHNFGATLSINISRSIEHDIRRERKRERGGERKKKKVERKKNGKGTKDWLKVIQTKDKGSTSDLFPARQCVFHRYARTQFRDSAFTLEPLWCKAWCHTLSSQISLELAFLYSRGAHARTVLLSPISNSNYFQKRKISSLRRTIVLKRNIQFNLIYQRLEYNFFAW